MITCRSVLGLVQHQVPLTPCGGEATSPIHSADSRRSQRSAALMRLANEGLMIDTKLPQVCSSPLLRNVRKFMLQTICETTGRKLPFSLPKKRSFTLRSPDTYPAQEGQALMAVS